MLAMGALGVFNTALAYYVYFRLVHDEGSGDLREPQQRTYLAPDNPRFGMPRLAVCRSGGSHRNKSARKNFPSAKCCVTH